LEAAKAGQRSIEHLSGVLDGTSSAEEQVRSRRAELLKGGEASKGIDVATRDALLELNERILATYDDSKASALLAAFVGQGTWHCPTLTVLRSMASLDNPAFTSDPRLKYIPVSIGDSWIPTNNARLESKRPVDYALDRRIFRKQLELVGAMRRAGVNFIAGTDAPNPFTFPGFSLHDELALLVEAGLTPLEAIQSATVNAAAYVGQSQEVGTIDVGKAADLVLLDSSPLDNISNTRRIAAVVIRGRLLQRAELDRTLNEAERIANLKAPH
jgi:imidazolonepropionase-like amidohydrolase